jgi:hypothetical protein
MDHWIRAKRTWLLTLSGLALPLLLTACGGSGSTAIGGSSGGQVGPTPTSAIAGVIRRVSKAYGRLGQATALPTWVKVGADGKSVALTITTHGSTFNGAGRGAMTITVPKGWQVAITDRNETTVAQSLVITGQTAMPLPATGFLPALAGAATAHPASGQLTGTQQVSFFASRAGNYLLVDDVPGRAAAGLWDHLDVSATAQEPSVQIG